MTTREHLAISALIRRDGDLQPFLDAGIDERHFYEERWRKAWQWALDYERKHGVLPEESALKRQFPSYKLVDTNEPLTALVEELLVKHKRVLLQEGLAEAVNTFDVVPMEKTVQTVESLLGTVRTAMASSSTRSLADIEAEEVTWLVENELAQGVLTLVYGAPNSGKSLYTLQLLNRFEGNVLLIADEDSPSMTIVPRLIAAGVDLGRVRTPSEPLYLPDDLPKLRSMLVRDKIKVLIVDPWINVLGDKADSNNYKDVMRGTQPYMDLAAELGIALLGVMHTRKSGNGGTSTEQLIGSRAHEARARVMGLFAFQGWIVGRRVQFGLPA